MKALEAEHVALTGTTLIEASAGTGKTYTITTLVLRLLLETGLGVEQILVVTYTRAATAELRDRIRLRLSIALSAARGAQVEDPFVRELVSRAHTPDARRRLVQTLERALYEIDQAPILTIHGFCQRVLSDHAFACSSAWDVPLCSHAAPLIEEIADDYYVGELSDASSERIQALDNQEPDKLRALSARCANRPELNVLPRELGHEQFDYAAWRAALEHCRDLFERDQEQIVPIVSAAAKAQARHVPNWRLFLQRTFASGEPGFSAAKNAEAPLRYFSASGIAQKSGATPRHAFFAALDRLREADEQFRKSAEQTRVSFRKNFVGYLQRELSQRTAKAGVRTFDALLHDVSAALHGPARERLREALRSEFRAALVDEFQDTDPLQYGVFREIFAGSAPLFLIGDPKQAIYGFRGADVFAYMEARHHAQHSYTLDTNRRSDCALVSALNQLYAGVTRPFALEGIDYLPVRTPDGARERLRARDGGAPLELLIVPADASGDALRKNIAECIASEIVRLLESASERFDEHHESGARFRRLRPRDIAVLCRMNREALLVQEALRARKVESVFQGDESVLESEDALELERLLTALAHPGDARALRSFLCSIYGGATADELSRLASDDRAWDEHRATFTRLSETWLEHGFMQAIRGLVVAYDVERKLLARPDGPRRVTNLWHLCELLSSAALEQRLGPLGLIRFLLLVRGNAAMRSELVGDAQELRLESNEDAVKLTTVHKSKGLEYPVVFLPFAWDTKQLRGDDGTFLRFHDEQGNLMLDLGSDEFAAHKEIAAQESLAENLRLLYVGLTRAKHRNYVIVPSVKGLGSSALGYTLLGGRGQGAPVMESPTEPHALASTLRGFGALTASGGIQVRVPEPANDRPFHDRAQGLSLSVRTIKRTLDEQYRVSSFSALASQVRSLHLDVGADHDAVEPVNPQPVKSTLLLDAFPHGAGPGQLVHEVLEHADFAADEPALRLVAASVLTPRGHDEAMVNMLSAGLHQTFHTPLPEADFALCNITPEHRLDELEFLLPVQSALTVRRLEQLFRAHKAPVADPSYAARLRNLTFASLTGFLRGFIDLVFEHQGRFYVVDYKSNRLGPAAQDYEQAGVLEAMAEHHYHLQYYLYVIAVHRYLRQRIADYDYDRHFGGVYYLFLRGMHPSHAPGTGVFFERPTRALVDELDRTLSRAEVAS